MYKLRQLAHQGMLKRLWAATPALPQRGKQPLPNALIYVIVGPVIQVDKRNSISIRAVTVQITYRALL